MTSRLIASLSVVAGIVAVCVFGSASLSGQSRSTPPPLVITGSGGKAVEYKAPRTPWGDPDLQGVWSSDDLENVPMSRPAQFQDLYLDDAQFAQRQAQVDRGAKQRDTSAESSFRFDYARRAMRQTSLIVDPPDGRLPAIKPAVQGRIMPRGTYGPGPLNSWEDFSLYERCITRGIAGSILRVIYGNGNRIVQAPGVVALSYEMLPDTRLFYTDGRAHIGASIGEYLGDSRARWEGEELVVETTNLTDKTAIGVNGNGVRHSKEMVITERFRRIADNMVQYQATYDDPVTYEKPFTVSFPLTPLDGGMLLPYRLSSRQHCDLHVTGRRTVGRTASGRGLRERHHPSEADGAGRWRGCRCGGAGGWTWSRRGSGSACARCGNG